MVFTFLLAVFVFITPSYAKKSKIKGDPELLWLSPLGSSDIENNEYNRCLFIKKIKPGYGHALEANQNTLDILSTYAANLYAQSIKLAGYIEAEKEKSGESDPDLSDEKALLDEEVTKRLADIARRMNIINSFEAGTMLLESLSTLNKLPTTTYEEFRVIKGGLVTYSSDCNDLK
jgi:hypothetical protein